MGIDLEKKIEEVSKRNRELTSQLLLVQEEERRRLADSIHKYLGQTLTLMVMQLNRLSKLPPEEVCTELDEIKALTDEIIQQTRDLSNSISIHELNKVGLYQALRNYFSIVQESTPIKVNFQTCGLLETRLARIVEISVFYIIQEAVTNVLKHAKTDEIDISIEVAAKVLKLRITDKGIGFAPDATKLHSPGMKRMHERAEVIGARWVVESSPGKGTLLSGDFPLP
jgi:signal transduction histidine kinase